jgi:hypothetical protein
MEMQGRKVHAQFRDAEIGVEGDSEVVKGSESSEMVSRQTLRVD